MKIRLILLVFLVISGCHDICEEESPPPAFKFKVLDEFNNDITNQGIYMMDSIEIAGYYKDGYTYHPDVNYYGDYFYFGTSGLVSSYTITYRNGDTDTITLDYVIISEVDCGDIFKDFSVTINGIENCYNCSNNIFEFVKELY